MTPKLKAQLNKHLNAYPHLQGQLKPYLSLALAGEAGELANIAKKEWRSGKGRPEEEFISEMADVGNYLFMLGELLDVDVLQAMENKLDEVEKRPEYIQHMKEIEDAKSF